MYEDGAQSVSHAEALRQTWKIQSDDENEYDDEKHSKLLETISRLDKKESNKTKTTKRSEPAPRVSEFALSSDGKPESKVKIHELMKSVKDRSGKIRKHLRKITHKKLVSLPLETSVAKEIHRKVLFEETSKEISKWDPVVEQIKSQPQIEFPLERPDLTFIPAHQRIHQLKPKTELEKAISKALKKSENVIKDEKVLTPAEERFLKAMNLEEARERHRQLQKTRALMSYQEAKLKRRAKIKSKKYHRLMKKERVKNEIKEFEEAKIKDPEKALEKLEQLEKMRALERASLKHMNTGKWSKNNKLRAKYDQKAREAIADQLETNKRLMTKTKLEINHEDAEDTSDEDKFDEELEGNTEMMAVDEFEVTYNDNPWLGRHPSGSALTAPAVYEQVQKYKVEAKKLQVTSQSEPYTSNSGKNGHIKEGKKVKVPKKIKIPSTTIVKVSTVSSEQSLKDAYKNADDADSNDEVVKKGQLAEVSLPENPEEPVDNQSTNLSIDPKKILDVKAKHISRSFPKLQEHPSESTEEEESDDENEQKRKLIAEAFAEDDLMEDFSKEKKEIEEREGDKDVCKFLPGWGHWSGPGIKENKKLKAKLTIRAKRKLRRDRNLGNVIISEQKDKAISKLTVKDLPYNCKNARQFEKTLKKPLGPNWNPETQFRHNIEPRVVVRMGKIIEPITEKALIKKKSLPKRRPLEQTSLTPDLIPV